MPREERPTPPAPEAPPPAAPAVAAAPSSNRNGTWLDSSLDLQQGLVVTEDADLNLFQAWARAFARMNLNRH